MTWYILGLEGEGKMLVTFPAMHGATHVTGARRHGDKAARQGYIVWNKSSKQIFKVYVMWRYGSFGSKYGWEGK